MKNLFATLWQLSAIFFWMILIHDLIVHLSGYGVYWFAW